MEGYDFPKPETQPDFAGNYPDFEGSQNTPLPYHSATQERFQEFNPAYAGEYHPGFMEARGAVPDTAWLAPAPGSENLRAPRDKAAPAIRGEATGTNRLFRPHGPVTGHTNSQWTGHRTDLRTPLVGNSGPVTGGRDGGRLAAQAYFAAQAAQYSQAASNAAMVSAL
jgi:hypothetical protein